MLEEVAEASAFVALVGVGWVALGRDVFGRWRRERRANARSRVAESAAVEASLEEVAFAPEAIRDAVVRLLGAAEQVSRGEAAEHVDRSERELINDWIRTSVFSRRFRLTGAPRVDLLRIVNRPGESEDRASVRVRVAIAVEGALPRLGAHGLRIDERWTLGRHRADWRLLETRGDPLSMSVLTGRLVPGAWADEDRLRERSLTELAGEDAPQRERGLDQLAASQDGVLAQLLDLSLADGWFLPDLLEAVIVHILEAWEEATIGSAQPLSEVVTPRASDRLLLVNLAGTPGRLVIRDATLKSWRPTAIDLAADEPVVTVELTIEAVRYIIDANRAEQLAGSREGPRTIALTWELGLSSSATSALWQLVRSSNPAADIPGLAAADHSN
jgi:hypothetical protein